MKIISWNVNGIKACVKKGLHDFVKTSNADVYCFQEVKSSPEEVHEFFHNLGYKSFYFPAQKAGYSGTLIYTKKEPVSVQRGLDIDEFDSEGRVITIEYDNFFLVNTYFPHTRRDLSRMDFKLTFNQEWFNFVKNLKSKKPVVLTGDFNVAHTEIDLANPKTNKKNAGFTEQERAWFTSFLEQGYVDTFRIFNQEGGNYTWWTYMHNARARNIGWRIDYFVVNEEIKEKVIGSQILPDVLGSDHCPIVLELELN